MPVILKWPFLPPRGCLAVSGDMLGCHNEGKCATGILGVEVREYWCMVLGQVACIRLT